MMAWFGSWRCNCATLTEKKTEIPDVCPTHSTFLLGPRELVEVDDRLALGIREPDDYAGQIEDSMLTGNTYTEVPVRDA